MSVNAGNATTTTITTTAATPPTANTSQLGTSECDGRSYELQFANEFVEKMHALRYTLETDLLACDAKWTLFVAAALSYRYDSQLKPFPPRFVSEQTGQSIDALVSVINDTPKLRVVLQNIIDQNYEEFDSEVLDLLHWVLVEMRDPALRLVEDEEFENLMSGINQKPDAVRPTHVFEVCQPLTSRSEEDFRTQSNQYPSKLAFYGNKLDSFLSVINYGFKQYQCNTNAYVGELLQLTTELSASLASSPNGAGWGASSCGSMIACVALCEFINHPEYVEIKPTTNMGGDSMSMDVTLRNADLARIRYLLFYGSRFPNEECVHGNLISWVSRHKYSLSLACYMLLLASIGVANSGSGQYLKHLVSRKALLILDFCRRIFVSD